MKKVVYSSSQEGTDPAAASPMPRRPTWPFLVWLPDQEHKNQEWSLSLTTWTWQIISWSSQQRRGTIVLLMEICIKPPTGHLDLFIRKQRRLPPTESKTTIARCSASWRAMLQPAMRCSYPPMWQQFKYWFAFSFSFLYISSVLGNGSSYRHFFFRFFSFFYYVFL